MRLSMALLGVLAAHISHAQVLGDCAETPPPLAPLDDANDAAGFVLGSPVEKARLLARLLVTEESSIFSVVNEAADSGEGPALVAALSTQTSLLERLVEVAFDDSPEAALDSIPRLGTSLESAIALARVFASERSDVRTLALHRLLDEARRLGFLDELNAALRAEFPEDDVIAGVVAASKPTLRPLIVAHRGGPPSPLYPENTMPAIENAVRLGADAIEIDLSLTADGEILLWHNATLGPLVSFARNMGLEPGAYYRPLHPDLFTDARRPVHELDAATVRREFGYEGTDGRRSNIPIPGLGEVAAYVAAHPQLERMVLDLKIPAGDAEVARRFAASLRSTLEANGITPDRVFLIHTDAFVVKTLQKALGPEFTVAHDVEVNEPLPSANAFDSGRSALELKSELASVGLPLLGINGREKFLEGLALTRARIDRGVGPKRLLVWTLNDELIQRESIAVGVDAILTDDPAALSQLLGRLGLAHP